MEQIRLIDKNNFNKITWPETHWSKKVHNFFNPLFEKGVDQYIDNIRTDLKVLQHGNILMPLAVNSKEYQNSYVASNYYGIHMLTEKLSQDKPLLAPIVYPFLLPVKGLMRFLKINKVVHMNTWFFSASLPPELTVDEAIAIREYLTERFPDHLLMFRTITNYNGRNLYEALRKAGFMLFPVREVYFYNPANVSKLPKKARHHRRRDFKLLESSGYEVVRNKDFTDEDIARMRDLYNKLYVKKYTSYSPQFSNAFMTNIIRNDLVFFVGLKKEGKIDGFIAYQKYNDMMQVPMMGYDTDLPLEYGLYRMISALTYMESESNNLILHDGHGADAFKTHRGLEKIPEYAAIYSAHFKNMRRLPWKLAEKVIEKIF